MARYTVKGSNDVLRQRPDKMSLLQRLFRGFSLDVFGRLDLPVFLRQLETLIKARIALPQALEIIAKSSQSVSAKKTINEISKRISEGYPLSEAFSRAQGNIPAIVSNMVHVGEKTGKLDEILGVLADFYEKTVKLRNKVITSLFYPGIVLFVAFVAITTVLMIVVPIYKEMFQEFEKALPLPTQIIIMTSAAIRHSLPFLFAGFALGLILLSKQNCRASVGRFIQEACLRAPLIKNIYTKLLSLIFIKTLELCLRGGLNIIESLEIACQSIPNNKIRILLKDRLKNVSSGGQIYDKLEGFQIIQDYVLQMIKVGELTGNLETMLGKAADYMENDLSNILERATSIIEPVLILSLGVILGGIILSLYMPMFDIINVVK
ncbi:MAG: hypothetical protein A2293_12365 [Elusimicrobia bacterium RIFOXYB2_FULL_49_7]|nr:MAG: hypothetical protein A2293_12365 [Elusimicrobia bacterium RIFOXYB2_FULL_49_7]